MIDYDADDDGLIEIRYLEQLDAVRHDRYGEGIPEDLSNLDIYRSAFPRAVFGMGCPFGVCDGYELMKDLDFRSRESYASGVVNTKWTEGVGWLPIGIAELRFNAEFNGNGHAITNLYISRTGLGDTGSTGLFGEALGSSEISNVRLLDVNVSGHASVGGLVGTNKGVIRAAYVGGSVAGNSEVGGVTGSNFGEIVDSSANVSVSGMETTGGLVGTSEGRVADSYATGNVSGQRNVGGLLGYSERSGKIVGSYFDGIVTGADLLGGLAGRNDGEILRSYSAGRVSGIRGEYAGDTGGLVGLNNSRGSIASSYSIAQVRGTQQVGGLVGVNDGRIEYSYASGNVIGSDGVGSLTGWNSGTILASYSTGYASGEREVGGLCGGNSDGAVIITSYAVGRVTDSRGDDRLIGGLVGRHYTEGRVINSYWNTQSTGQQLGFGRGVASGARGATTAQMQSPTSYTGIYRVWNVDIDNADGDFDPSTGRDDLWDFGNSRQYPALRVDFDGDGVASWQEFGDQRGNRGCGSNASCP